MRLLLRTLLVLLILACIAGVAWYALSRAPSPEAIQYGVSFNTPYAQELGVPWRDVYAAILDDLQVKHLRLAAHWPMVEPTRGTWNFVELDEQMALAEAHGADVILAVGRRLPRWPECHVPAWARTMSWDAQKDELRAYIRAVVARYKDSPALLYWQVENEPFLSVFAGEQCGVLDTAFLDEEVALVKELDPSHRILLTDSGNLGTWYGAYRRGDIFGTSVYVHLWNPTTGAVRTILPPSTYIVKRNLMSFAFGPRETLLIELSLEPWLGSSVADTPVEQQLERMNMDRMREVLKYARGTKFTNQYLWGAEWWYWMRAREHPEFWDAARELIHNTEPITN